MSQKTKKQFLIGITREDTLPGNIEKSKKPKPDHKVGRRRLLRLGAAGILGGVVVTRALRGRARKETPRFSSNISFLPECVGCTGCIAICPPGAITSTPRGIEVIDDRCIRCGYCVAACPVRGIRVNKESK